MFHVSFYFPSSTGTLCSCFLMIYPGDVAATSRVFIVV